MRYNNRPPHFYQDESLYFLAARTFNNAPYFDSDQKKNIILMAFSKALEEYNFRMFAWVILDNHYHCQVRVEKGTDLSGFIQKIHGLSARNLNKLENASGRKIWWNYWDKCLNSEKDFWVHFNYIHNNPIKHGYVKNIKGLASYRFCSYNYYLKIKSQEWLNSIFAEYPVVDFALDND